MEAARTILAVVALMVAMVPVVQAAVVPAELSIMAPTYALVGAPISVTGTHAVRAGLLLPYAAPSDVALYVDGVAAGADATSRGNYQITTTFPARGAYTVHAVANDGGPAEARSEDRIVQAATVPGAPLHLAALLLPGAPSVRLTWDAPADDGGAPVVNYLVQRRDGATGAFATRATLTTRSFDDAGLTLGNTYTYRVIAASAVGNGAPAITGVTGDLPPAPLVSATPVDMSANARVTIESAGGSTQGFLVERSTDGGATWSTIRTFSGSGTRVFSDELWFDADPIYRGIARTLVGGTPAAPVAPTGDLPGAPGTPTTWIDHENGNLHVNWTAPASGGPVQGWRLLVDGVQRFHLAPWIGTSWAFDPTPGTHTYSIVASSMLGDGPESDAAALTIQQASAPTVALSFVEETERAFAHLAWTTPADDGGSAIRAFAIYRSDDGGSPRQVGTTASEELAFVDQVPDGHSFTYSVHALTTVGPGLDGTASGSVASFDWALSHAIHHFTACEGSSCTTVAPGGTYDRVGTGMVRYSATYAGLLTRRGAPAEGVDFIADIWETNDTEGEMTEGNLVLTNATGEYSVSWTRDTSLTPVGCVPIRFNSLTWYRHVSVYREADSFTLCP